MSNLKGSTEREWGEGEGKGEEEREGGEISQGL